jgi:uncharacterized phage protein (TIGR01671 family)
MNREIKFRAWDDGAMIYSHNNDFNHSNLQNEWFFKTIREGAIIMQFTGLKDKNGKEIYEGDIVKIYDEYIRSVSFANAFWNLDEIFTSGVLGGFGTETESGHKPLYRYGTQGIEVICNIYETPELLNLNN